MEEYRLTFSFLILSLGFEVNNGFLERGTEMSCFEYMQRYLYNEGNGNIQQRDTVFWKVLSFFDLKEGSLQFMKPCNVQNAFNTLRADIIRASYDIMASVIKNKRLNCSCYHLEDMCFYVIHLIPSTLFEK